MKKPFAKLFKEQQIINYKKDVSEKAIQAMQERIFAGVRQRLNAPAPSTLAEPDLSFKYAEDPHFWRGK
tara:strand:+ start:354 stop:560 length:207 start_codon:yes stop_codon:yes gene_type:complete